MHNFHPLSYIDIHLPTLSLFFYEGSFLQISQSDRDPKGEFSPVILTMNPTLYLGHNQKVYDNLPPNIMCWSPDQGPRSLHLLLSSQNDSADYSYGSVLPTIYFR